MFRFINLSSRNLKLKNLNFYFFTFLKNLRRYSACTRIRIIVIQHPNGRLKSNRIMISAEITYNKLCNKYPYEEM